MSKQRPLSWSIECRPRGIQKTHCYGELSVQEHRACGKSLIHIWTYIVFCIFLFLHSALNCKECWSEKSTRCIWSGVKSMLTNYWHCSGQAQQNGFCSYCTSHFESDLYPEERNGRLTAQMIKAWCRRGLSRNKKKKKNAADQTQSYSEAETPQCTSISPTAEV